MKTVLLSKIISRKQFRAIEKIFNDKSLKSNKQIIDTVVDYLKPDEERINNLGLDLRFLAYNPQFQLGKQ